MKTKIIIGLALTSLVASVQSGFAEEKKERTYSKHGQSASSELIKVSSEDIKQITTAKGIIDKLVYDASGEKIGTVQDISIGQKLGGSMTSYSSSSSSSPTRDPSLNTQRESQTSESPSGRESQTTTGQNRYSASSPSDSASMRGQGNQYAFISIGGVFGVGSDLIRVPLSSLQQDAEEDRLILQGYSKSAVDAVAEQEAVAFDSSDYEDNAYKAKRVWDDKDDKKKKNDKEEK